MSDLITALVAVVIPVALVVVMGLLVVTRREVRDLRVMIDLMVAQGAGAPPGVVRPRVVHPGQPGAAPQAAAAVNAAATTPYAPARTHAAAPPTPDAPAIPSAPAPPYPAQTPTGVPPGAQAAFRVNESLLGRNVLPVLAAGLGLVGLVFLGILVVPLLPQAVQIALMYLISVAVGYLGMRLGQRRASVLAHALTGTGVGGVFVATFVTHLVFDAIPDLVALALLAGWIVAALWLSRRANSLVVAVLAHAGLIASIVMAYLGGVGDARLLVVVIYQMVATVGLTLGNVFFTRPMYRFGLFASQAMIVYGLAAMWSRLDEGEPGFASTLSTGWIAAGFSIQFLGATAIAYLLFVSCARVKRPRPMGWLAALNATAWAVVLVQAVARLVNKIVGSWYGLDSWAAWQEARAVVAPLLISLVAAYLPGLALVLAARRLPVNPALQRGTVVPLGVASAGLLVIAQAGFVQRYDVGDLTGMAWGLGLAGAWIGLGALARDRAVAQAGRLVLVVVGLIMVVPSSGYALLTQQWTIAASLAYLGLLLGLAYLSWRQVEPDRRRRYSARAGVAVVALIELSLAAISFTSGLDFAAGLFVVTTAVVVAVRYWWGPARGSPAWRLVELGAIALGAWALYQAGPRGGGADITLASLGVLVVLVVIADRVRRAARANSAAVRAGAGLPSGVQEVISGLALTIGLVGLLTPYDWFLQRGQDIAWGYPVSLACMLVSLVLVGLGLWSRVKALRLYGLVVTLACVLKLVLVDLGLVTPITRVVAFLGGAAVCFAISALYNYAAKQFDKTLATPPPQSAPHPPS
jgi:hypothetical protein